MKFRLYKPEYNGTVVLAGVFLPDGFNRVFRLTRENAQNIEWQQDRGYEVEEVEDSVPCGLYEDATGRRVDEASVEVAVKPMAPDGAAIRYLADDAPEYDPLETLGVDYKKRGYVPKGPPVSKRSDLAMEQKRMSVTAGARRGR